MTNILRSVLLANAIALSISSSSADEPAPQSVPAADLLASAASPLQTSEIVNMPASQHTDFGGSLGELSGANSPTIISDQVAQLSSLPALEESSRVPILRREPASISTPQGASRRIFADAPKRENMDTEEEESEEGPHRLAYQEDPRFTPEAIFANKKLSPDVAEFLGHLAQRTRVHRKENYRAAKAAGLISEGRAKQNDAHMEDDSEDIEDMKKSLKSRPMNTPLAHFFELIDTKAAAGSWNQGECQMLMKNITDKYESMLGRSRATWATTGPAGAAGRAEVHTGMFFDHWKLNNQETMKAAARKLRLGVLSFLATQDAGKVKLHIWTDLEKSNKTIRDMLGPIAHHPEFMDAINITTFDPKVEFSKVFGSLAQETLADHFKKDTMPEIRPDLYRAVILYNNGGIWMDADSVLMQDVAPLLGEDWAYLIKGNQGLIDGALLSASRPRSHFSNAYLVNVVMYRQPVFPDIEKPKSILEDLYNTDPAHTIMHVLPPCFLDSDTKVSAGDAAVLTSGTSVGSDFFGTPVGSPYRAYFSVGIQDAKQDNSTAEVSLLDDATFKQSEPKHDDDDEDAVPTSPVWAYHWRGNFAAPWARGSLADVAERTFIHKLGLQHHKWN